MGFFSKRQEEQFNQEVENLVSAADNGELTVEQMQETRCSAERDTTFAQSTSGQRWIETLNTALGRIIK